MNYKKQLIIPLMILSLSTLSFATVYSDGEDGTVGNWKVHDNKPTGAVISNVIDDVKNSKVIEFKGDARRNSYMLGSRDWNNRTEKQLKWSMLFSEKFKITVYIKTKKGVRTLFYDYKNVDKGLYQKRYIKIGLGERSQNGTWQNFSRDIEADLKKYEPDNELVKIKGMKVQGSGYIDNVRLETRKPEDSCLTREELESKIQNNEDVTKVDTSCVEDMSKLFIWTPKFNQDISNWDVSNVVNMNGMFYETTHFNQDISNWDVSNVTNMYSMFGDAKNFKNHDLTGWNVTKVKEYKGFFTGAGKNNIEPKWNTSNTPEEAILTKAKEHCLGKDKSTTSILCSNEKNIVYIVETKKIKFNTNNNKIYRISIEKNKENVEMISKDIQTQSRYPIEYFQFVKLKNTPIYLKKFLSIGADDNIDWSFMYKGKQLFTQHSNDKDKSLYDIHTDTLGKKLTFSYRQGYEKPYGVYMRTYDISNPNKMVLIDTVLKPLR